MDYSGLFRLYYFFGLFRLFLLDCSDYSFLSRLFRLLCLLRLLRIIVLNLDYCQLCNNQNCLNGLYRGIGPAAAGPRQATGAISHSSIRALQPSGGCYQPPPYNSILSNSALFGECSVAIPSGFWPGC